MGRRTTWTALAALLAGGAAGAVARPAGAEPQASVGVTVGAVGEGLDNRFWNERTAFHLGLHGDVLFGRSATHDFGSSLSAWSNLPVSVRCRPS